MASSRASGENCGRVVSSLYSIRAICWRMLRRKENSQSRPWHCLRAGSSEWGEARNSRSPCFFRWCYRAHFTAHPGIQQAEGGGGSALPSGGKTGRYVISVGTEIEAPKEGLEVVKQSNSRPRNVAEASTGSSGPSLPIQPEASPRPDPAGQDLDLIPH